jgi:hypothetical protein
MDICHLAEAGILTVLKKLPMYQYSGFDSKDTRFSNETKYNSNRLIG